MKIALFAATEKGLFCLRKAIEKDYADAIGLVVSFKEVNVDKSYDEEIALLCRQHGIDFFYWKEIKENVVEACKMREITVAFAIGWKYLITTRINETLEEGLIIFHDSLLPRYRGFAPTPTAIICGEKEVGVTALYADEKADCGNIILQKKIEVKQEDYISDVIKKQTYVYADMLMEILTNISNKNVVSRIQDEKQATYSIWRDLADCKIEWTDSAENIYNLIRAVSHPYMGAFCYYQSKKIVIEKAEVIEDKNFAVRQCGKIWAIINNMPEVICGNGMLRIIEARHEDGSIVVFDKLRERL